MGWVGLGGLGLVGRAYVEGVLGMEGGGVWG